MRTLVTVTVGTEAGNGAIKDGSLPKIIEAFMREYKPEAAYFTTTEGGERSALFVIDLADPSAIPSMAEPFFMGLNARVTFRPVMNPDELSAGLQRLPR